MLVVAFVTPASAISNGQVDDSGKFPYVGMVLVPASDGFFWMCSGTLLEGGKKVLTAAHCIDDYGDPGAETAYFSPKDDPQSLSDFRVGTIHPHPKWCIGCGPGLKGFDTHDVAVIVLDEPISMSKTARLPAEGYVDTLKKAKVDIVGYGMRRVKGKPKLARTDIRYYALARLVPSNHVHSDEFVKLSAGIGKDDMGGTCFGDSGGPNIEHGTDTVLAVTSYGNNAICAGVGYSNRVDLKDILSFIRNTN